MVNPATLLDDLCAFAAALDDQAWETLSNRGLLRRARKDFRPELCSISSQTKVKVQVSVTDQRVDFASKDPRDTSCTCGATTLCRHRLMALMFLAQLQKDSGTQSSPRPGTILLDLSSQDLETWRGLAAWRKAWEIFDRDEPRVLSSDSSVKLGFEQSCIEVSFLGQSGLDAAVLNTKVQAPEPWVLAAALKFRRTRDLLDPRPKALARQVPEVCAPRSRLDLLASAQTLLEQITKGGLSRPAPHYVHRLSTLSIALQAHKLSRLANELRTISNGLEDLVRKKAEADPGSLFLQIARSYALCVALQGNQRDRPDLSGSTQDYLPATPLELVGVGAERWRTPSGYLGLTLHFIDVRNGGFYTWSDLRIHDHDELFDPLIRFRQAGPWKGLRTPSQASRSHFHLSEIKRTAQGRLSNAQTGQARVMGPSQPSLLHFAKKPCTLWQDLYHQAQALITRGLSLPASRPDLAFISPRIWDPGVFDPISQCYYQTLLDERGDRISLCLPYDDEHAEAIAYLETLEPASETIWALFCRLVCQGPNLSLKPISIIFDRPEKAVLNLSLDTHSAFKGSKRSSAVRPRPPASAQVQPRRALILDQVNRVLEAQVERGQVVTGDPKLSSLITHCHDAGHLTLCKRLRAGWGTKGQASDLLKARYLVELYQSILEAPRPPSEA